MPETTHRWAVPLGHVAPPLAEPAETPPPPDALPLTLVSDRAPARPVVPPILFPGYDILAELGRGGMGVVYKARHRNLNRLVALKVILGGPLASAEDKARFRIEAEAAARLHHPNIVQVYDVGEHAGFSFIALELVEGQTLRQWQNGQPLEPRAAARVVAAIARAIQHAHEQGIVHRDLKPANILLAPVPTAHPELASTASAAVAVPLASGGAPRPSSGDHAALTVSPKVTDFGLAKSLEGGNDLTRTGVACGTPNYMAPEQVRGQALGPGVDVYGLGAVLYELLAGRPPFVGSDATEVMNLILKSDPPGVRRFAPGVPRDLAVIAAKCLEKDPARRYLSAREAADDLDRFLAGKPILARPVSAAERAVRWVRRNPVVAAFLFISTIGCTVTGGLAVALARAATDERGARSSAEAARDDLRVALTDAEAARALAEREQKASAAATSAAGAAREAAKQEAARARAKQAEADVARGRAERNLRAAQGVIRTSVNELSRDPNFAQEEFRVTRQKLIPKVRAFRDSVAEHGPNTQEWLEELSDVSFALGFLEYRNHDFAAAALEYRASADAAGRLAKLDPRNLKARAQQAFALLNAGNALMNTGRYREVEPLYLDATRLIDEVLAAPEANQDHQYQAVESYGKLARMYEQEGNAVGWERAARQELDRAGRLAEACGHTPRSLGLHAAARSGLAQALARQKKWGDADTQFAALLETRERVRDACPGDLRAAGEHFDAVLAYSHFLTTRGQPDRAAATARAAIEALEAARDAAPDADPPALALASAAARYADFLRARNQPKEAERRYDQALEATAAVALRGPSAPARAVAATAAKGRAHLYNATGRHREAAAEWARLATEDPNLAARTHHALFVLQSLLFAGDWRAAVAAAGVRMAEDQPAWMWLEMAHALCRAVKQVERDESLAPDERAREAEKVVALAVTCLERSQAKGEFATPERITWFAANTDFAPVRGKFEPAKK